MLVFRRRRAHRLHLEQEDDSDPAIQPFNLHPFTLIRHGLLHASDRVFKVRLVPESPLLASKFRDLENTPNFVNSQATIPGPESPSPGRNPALELSPPLLNPRLREQDSGLRIVAETAEEENMSGVLPPEYTAT